MRGGSITLRELERYIGSREGLRKDLQKDFRNNRMLAEGDLETGIHFHLRDFLKADKRWQIYARAHSKGLGRYPDLTLVQDFKRRIVLELKWSVPRISKKDRRVLSSFLEAPHARRAYFVTTAGKESDYRKLGAKKTELEKYRLKEIVVALGLRGSRLRERKAKRESIREALM